jgi:hypothetical protein
MTMPCLERFFSIDVEPLPAAILAALLLAAPLGAQPSVEPSDVRCISREAFTELAAAIEPPGSIRSAKLYFRSAVFSDFYFVDMKLDSGSGSFRAVLPLPTAETDRVVYYVEAVDVSFQTARSRDFQVTVSNGCRPGPGGLLFSGRDPGIVVGALRAGAPALPAGFQATGIAGFVSAAGSVAGAGGGIGLPVILGAAAGAATGVGVLVAAGSESGSTSTGASGGPLTPGGPTGGGSSVSTTTAPTSSTGGPSSPSSTTTTTITGSPSPPSTTSTSSSPSTTSSVAPAVTACFTSSPLGGCKVDFASCSTPESAITRYEWRMLGPPPVPEPPQVPRFTFAFDADPRCAGTNDFNRPVRLTVYDADGGSAAVQENVLVRPGPRASVRPEPSSVTRLSFESELVATPADGSVRGRVLVEGSPLALTDNGSPLLYEIGVGEREISVEASLLTPAPAGSLWVMDFSATDRVIPGSLRVERGTVSSVTERRIAFRLSGLAGETMRFRLELR